MAKKQDLKAYVRLDYSGRVVAGSLILRKKMPKVGKWVEVQAYECCNYTTTTTIAPVCITYEIYVSPETIVYLSYNDCDGTPRGPFEMNGEIDDYFCCIADSYTITGDRAYLVTVYAEGCNRPTTTTTTTIDDR